ncbi:MAG: hypothetical protein EP329_23895 [Deltaproteobacteria bacterium]|nr:MAG: hypothetical protein EP329_23895 [Deltaproteobacteria bacterium]
MLRRTIAVSLALHLGACLQGPSAAPGGGRLALSVAPLSYPGITNATFDLEVANQSGQVVFSRSLDSLGYGSGDGSLSYVGTCDGADGENPNTVSLTLTGLYAGAGGSTLIDPGSYRNPGTLTRSVDCVPNSDVAVDFDLTIARAANQGFFDIAIAFEDIFCSAKLDCVDEGGAEIRLLHTPDGSRGRTVVLGLACTGDLSVGGETRLYRDPVVVTCSNGTASVDPGAGPGNLAEGAGVTSTGTAPLFGAAVYRGNELLGFNKSYWNVLLGLADTAADCAVTTTATASPRTLTGGQTPAGTAWPYVVWDVGVTGAAGVRVCTSHPIDGAAPNDGVYTAYTGLDTPETFDALYYAGAPNLGQDVAHAAASCADIYAGDPTSVSGEYWIDGPSGVALVYCDMPSGTALILGASANANWTEIAAGCPAGWEPFAIDSFARVAIAEDFVATQTADWFWLNFFAGPEPTSGGALDNEPGWLSGGGVGTWTSSGFLDTGATDLPNLNFSGNQNTGIFDPIPLSRTLGFANRGGGATVLYNSTEQTLLGPVVCGLPHVVVQGALTAADPGRWSDGTVAESCDAYLHPTGGQEAATSDGVYRIDPDGDAGPVAPLVVTCDMTADDGGWTRVARGLWLSNTNTMLRSDSLPDGYILTEATLDALRAVSTDLYRLGPVGTRFYVRDASPLFTTHYWRTNASSVECSKTYAEVTGGSMITTSEKTVNCDALAIGSHTCGSSVGWILLHQNDTFNFSGAHPCGYGTGGYPTGQGLTDLWLR